MNGELSGPAGRAVPATGWLVEQLPRPLAEDPFVQRFVGIFEDISTTVHGRIDGVGHLLDPGLGPPEFVRWMGGWIGSAIDASLPDERQRHLVRTAGRLLGWRGTRIALQGLLEALTDRPVEVRDSGGVFPAGRTAPGGHQVTVHLEDTGGVDEQQLLVFVKREVPADATVELLVGGRAVEAPDTSPPSAPEVEDPT
jgi:phage tail-like protein